MPPQVATIAGAVKPAYNGAWIYTDGDNPGLYLAPKRSFLPRLGIAYRVNDKTALRVGYARYAVIMSVLGYSWILPSTDGYSQTSNGPVQVLGVPQGYSAIRFPRPIPWFCQWEGVAAATRTWGRRARHRGRIRT